MSGAIAKIPKPVMRKLHETQMKRDIYQAIAFSLTLGALYKFLVAEPRKVAYAEFYKNYDIDEHFERMRKKGVFDSCPAD